MVSGTPEGDVMICDLTLLTVTVTGVGLFFLQAEKKTETNKKLSNNVVDLLMCMFFVFLSQTIC